MPSFDVVSEVDQQEVRNAVDQAARELAQRYDFKGTDSTVELKEATIELRSVSEDRLNAVRTVLEEKLVKRKVSLKGVEFGRVEDAAGGTARQVATLSAGISSDKAREVNKAIKELAVGDVLEIIATDVGTLKDIPSWCERMGQTLLSSSKQDKVLRFYVRKDR